jgi:Cu+-exporting ATPase
MAKDPICDMTVDEATGLRAERDGQTFYFCSEYCRSSRSLRFSSVSVIANALRLRRLEV